MIKAVIFDLDDTLISEREYVKSGYKHIANIISKKYSKNEKQVFDKMMELLYIDTKNVFNRLLDCYNIKYDNNEILSLVKQYRMHTPKVKFYEDVLPFLQVLKNKKIKIGIITDGYKQSQRLKLNVIDANKYFDEIIVTDELGKEYWKPNSKSFEIMKKKMNVEYNEMIYVGDNPEKDFFISKIYPIKTVRIIRDGFYKEKRYKEGIKEDLTIKKLDIGILK